MARNGKFADYVDGPANDLLVAILVDKPCFVSIAWVPIW